MGTERPERPERCRADVLVHRAGLAPSRERARALILAGRVFVGERRVEKAGDSLPADAALSVRGDDNPFVSRGGLKLAHALETFGIDVVDRRCLDVGASTGGFTDCLLQAGAAHVVAVDVGKGQLDASLRQDARVTLRAETNARHLAPEDVGEPPPTLVAIDVSFIAVTKVLPAIVRSAPGAELVVLVKPQFEAGRGEVGRKGVVREPRTWRRVVGEVADCLEELGLELAGATLSPARGPAGNAEFLLHALPRSAGGAPDRAVPDAMLDAAVASASRGRGRAKDR